MKYIRTKDHGVVLFGRHISHKDFANRLCTPMSCDKVLSAGFVRLEALMPECYGKSESLGLQSKPEEDSQMLRAQVMIY